MSVADQMAKPGANLRVTVAASVAAKVSILNGQLPEVTIGRRQRQHLDHVITGEVGKLVSVRVEAVAM